MSHKLIVGNWKMNMNPAETSVLLHRLASAVPDQDAAEVVVCPPFVSITAAKQDMDPKFKLGAQDLHYLDHGPYTGEVSGAMLQGLVDYVIVGHSERRKENHENDKLIAKKLAAAYRNGLTPILCVGDNLHEREHHAAKKVVVDQLTADTAMLTSHEVSQLVVAYEPVWAIGSGDFASPDIVRQMVKTIRHTLEELYGESSGATVRVLYGGSVVPDNSGSYLKIEGVDGLLVGGASLNYEHFTQIIKSAE